MTTPSDQSPQETPAQVGLESPLEPPIFDKAMAPVEGASETQPLPAPQPQSPVLSTSESAPRSYQMGYLLPLPYHLLVLGLLVWLAFQSTQSAKPNNNSTLLSAQDLEQAKIELRAEISKLLSDSVTENDLPKQLKAVQETAQKLQKQIDEKIQTRSLTDIEYNQIVMDLANLKRTTQSLIEGVGDLKPLPKSRLLAVAFESKKLPPDLIARVTHTTLSRIWSARYRGQAQLGFAMVSGSSSPKILVPFDSRSNEGAIPPLQNMQKQLGGPNPEVADLLVRSGSEISKLLPRANGEPQPACLILADSSYQPPNTPEQQKAWQGFSVSVILIFDPQTPPKSDNLADWIKFCSASGGTCELVTISANKENPAAAGENLVANLSQRLARWIWTQGTQNSTTRSGS